MGALGFLAIWDFVSIRGPWKYIDIISKYAILTKMFVHDIFRAEADTKEAFEHFCESYPEKCEKKVRALEKHRKEAIAFYRFPAPHWKRIRRSNVTETGFATVRLGSHKTRERTTHAATLAMMFKLLQEATESS